MELFTLYYFLFKEKPDVPFPFVICHKVRNILEMQENIYLSSSYIMYCIIFILFMSNMTKLIVLYVIYLDIENLYLLVYQYSSVINDYMYCMTRY